MRMKKHCGLVTHVLFLFDEAPPLPPLSVMADWACRRIVTETGHRNTECAFFSTVFLAFYVVLH